MCVCVCVCVCVKYAPESFEICITNREIYIENTQTYDSYIYIYIYIYSVLQCSATCVPCTTAGPRAFLPLSVKYFKTKDYLALNSTLFKPTSLK